MPTLPMQEALPGTTEMSAPILQSLSLDVVAGGVCGAALAATVARASMPPAWWLALAAAIWIVYTADHLVDALSVGPDAANARHRLHVRHTGLLLALVIVVGVAAALVSAVALPPAVIFAGALVGLLVLLHLAGVRRGFPRLLPKELSVAVIYTCGIWCGPLALGMPLDRWRWLVFALHLLAAFLYLLLYALFEMPVDRADESPSIALDRGRAPVRRLLDRLTIAGLALGVAGLLAAPALRAAFAALVVVVAVPALVARACAAFAYGGRYRHAEWMFLLLALPALLR